MENIYNILYEKVPLKAWEMPYELENLARQLVLSGRFRIDADEKVNFVRFSRPSEGINMVFSYRELCDETLCPRTTKIIRHALSRNHSGSQLKSKTNSELKRLQHDVTKILGVDIPTEIKLARAIIQAAEPCVIMLLLAEGAELFVSYSHTVGDMLDIQSWQDVGSSSGLQSTGHMESAVFVSCGGNPFLPEDQKRHEGEGFNALARMIVIGGQELGHFADLIRDKRGRKISRHSANGNIAKERIRLARLADITNASEIKAKLTKFNLKKLTELERRVKFFKKQKRNGLIKINTQRTVNNLTRRLLRKCRWHSMGFLHDIQPDSDKHIATPISMMVSDMLFNLSPKADAYKRDDPAEEEGIACIEALARIPQQVNKWGHIVTKSMMPNLYSVYYNEVIPACKQAYQNISGQPYEFNITKKPLLNKLIDRIFHKGP